MNFLLSTSTSPTLTSVATATFLLVLAPVLVAMARRQQQQDAAKSNGQQKQAKPERPWATVPPEKLPQHMRQLLAELPPHSVILQGEADAFQQALDYSWALTVRETIPALIVRPRDTRELGQAVAILKREHDALRAAAIPTNTTSTTVTPPGLFAVRSGGVNPGLGAASLQDGVLIDLSLFNEVTPAPDGSTVTLGTGSKWIDVYKKLDKHGITVLGGRSSPVGVGGLALQGGISFYSPRFGFVCSNVVSYEVVLADGTVVTATESEHADLWRVMKGGCNNFGIVTRFTIRSLPSAPVWSMRMFAPAFQHAKAISIYHEYVKYASSGQPGAFDENAAGPILSFCYVRGLPLQVIAMHLLYTKVTAEDEKRKGKKWPTCWKKSGFDSLWSFHRTAKIISHSDVVDSIGRAQPAGTRHMQGTTTIRNTLGAMTAAYGIFCQTTAKFKQVKGALFPFTFQTVLPAWMNKGYPNVFGLQGCTEPLLIINCSVTWAEAKDDQLVRSTVRDCLAQIDAAAAAGGWGHPWRYTNYSMEFQRPLDGRGEENWKLMWAASEKYDPTGLFQTGCTGGFKLDLRTGNA